MKAQKIDRYHYIECGLSQIFLRGIETLICQNSGCADKIVAIPNIEKLHELIADEIAVQKNKLLPEEIKFLRKYLGFSGRDFGKKIGVSSETVTRWERGKLNMKEAVERLLRVLILSKAGPFIDYEDLEKFATTKRSTPLKRSFKISKKIWVTDAA